MSTRRIAVSVAGRLARKRRRDPARRVADDHTEFSNQASDHDPPITRFELDDDRHDHHGHD